ncbi:MAG: tetratricopeptide repeat protein [Candidatus Krumholzibacteria bacterium]|nr:tetratricopeptide repeat protein [Candidatus Krumholzibacteria bacterium]
MTPILSLSSLLDSIAPGSLLWWLSRMTLLATLACAFLVFAHRLRPAVRHAVAVGSLVAIALLPLASALVPAWSIPVLPAPAARLIQSEPVRPDAIEPAPMTASRHTPAVATSAGPVAPARTQGVETVVARARDTLVTSIGWKGAIVLVWLNVMVALLLRAGLAAMWARGIVRSAPVTRDENILRESQRVRRILGIQRPVDVIVSPRVAVPLVACALRPCVVLPTDAENWSRERLNAVLLHEFAHVRRRDGLWVMVARVVCAVFWFQPLAWVLATQLRADAERACDDVVLSTGIRNSDYAEHLVAIARLAPGRDVFAGAALTLTTRSSLERRVISILTTRTPRAAMSRRALASLACVSLVLLVAVAAARPTTAVSPRAIPADKLALIDVITPDESVRLEKRAPMRLAYTVANMNDAGRDLRRIELAGSGKDGESGRDYYREAADLYNSGRYSRAAAAFSKAAELGYKRPTALYNAGCSYALADEKDDAIEALRAAFEEGFERPDLYAADDDLNSLRGDARFQKLLGEVMNSDVARLDRRDANREFDRLAKRDNVEEDEWNSVGIDLLRSGDYERAADAFDREFKVSGDDGALYNMACARSLGGQKDAALKLLEQAITTGSVDARHMGEDPDLFPLHSEKRFDELLTMAKDLSLSTNWDGDRSWHWGWRGSENNERAWRKAIPHFEEMAKKYPRIGRAWFNLGFVQLRTEQAGEATASFQKALDMGYQKPTTMYNLACCAAQAGNVDAAFDWLKKADEAGFESWEHAYRDHDLDPIQDDPRFKEYRERWKSAMSYKHKQHFQYRYQHDHNQDDDDPEVDVDRNYD